MGSQAWLDFYSRLDKIKKSMEEAILMGMPSQDGLDTTPAARACYGLLMNIMAIPARMEQERLKAEEMLGVYEEDLDNPANPMPQ